MGKIIAGNFDADFWRRLLVKYIQHVSGCEGVTFLSDHKLPSGRYAYRESFTDEEWEALKQCEALT